MEIQPKLELSLQTIVYPHAPCGLLHITVSPPPVETRRPCAIICAIDTSGSMHNPSAEEKADDLSVLDLVKHAVRTAIQTLGDNDYLALVSFESLAHVLLDLTRMDSAGKKLATEKLGDMVPQGGTNIWDALKTSIGIANSHPACANINTSLWLFTDGAPNENPPEGIMSALGTLLGHKSPPCVINTFGFGYSLDSKLLYDISEYGNGIFCYLPDCNLVGTTFVNCLCNTLSSAAFRTSLKITNTKNASDLECIGYRMKDQTIELGCVRYGQSRDILLRFKQSAADPPAFLVSLRTHLGEASVKSILGYKAQSEVGLYKELSRSVYAEKVLAGLKQHEEDAKSSTEFLNELTTFVASLPSKDDPDVLALMKDLVGVTDAEGRVTKAFSTPERVKRWGGHYVRSIVRAHQLQECHNFKDPGVQHYGAGKLFKDLQNKADLVFCSLPPPPASLKKEHDDILQLLKSLDPAAYSQLSAQVSAAAIAADAPPAQNMQEYNDCGGGCFYGATEVDMLDGSRRKICELHKGDRVKNGAEVVCLVEFPTCGGIAELVEICGVRLTPKHPVRINGGDWMYPRTLGKAMKTCCDAVYNVVLDRGHVLNLGETEAVTLGHGLQGNAVVSHEYYGAKKSVEDVKRRPGWETGKVSMAGARKFRDPLTGRLVTIQ